MYTIYIYIYLIDPASTDASKISNFKLAFTGASYFVSYKAYEINNTIQDNMKHEAVVTGARCREGCLSVLE